MTASGPAASHALWSATQRKAAARIFVRALMPVLPTAPQVYKNMRVEKRDCLTEVAPCDGGAIRPVRRNTNEVSSSGSCCSSGDYVYSDESITPSEV